MNLIIGNSHPSLHKLPPARWTVVAKQHERGWIWLTADRYPSVTCAKMRDDGLIITAQRKAPNGVYELVARPARARR